MVKCAYCEKETKDEFYTIKGKIVCEDCAADYGEAQYFEEQAKKERELIRNLDDFNPLGISIL